MTSSDVLTQQELQELLEYFPETGQFFWRVSKGSRGKVSNEAGNKPCKTHGYCFIRIHKKLYRAHHLAWLYVHGKFPEKDIDHINQNRADNRLKNLREVDRSINNLNSSLRKGYYFSTQTGKYIVERMLKGKKIYAGQYATEEEAKDVSTKLQRQILAEICSGGC